MVEVEELGVQEVEEALVDFKVIAMVKQAIAFYIINIKKGMMIMDYNKKIGYRPNIKYTDEYESDIDFSSRQSSYEQSDSNDDNSLIENLLEQGDSLQNMIDKLPDFISDKIKDSVDPIIDFVNEELKNKKLEKVPVELEWIYESDDFTPETYEPEDNDSNYDDPDIGIWDPDDDVFISKEVHTKEEIIQKEYIKNLYDLFDDYFNNLHTIISNFWSGLLYSIMNKSSSEISVIMNNILLSSSDIKDDKKHILDSVVKAEINRDMKLRYFSNNFNAEGSLKHLKNFKAVYELRCRYAKIDENENPISRADQMSNNILKGMSLSYDLKYDKTYENLYRYLKSSNIILEDALNSAVQSLRGKQTLIDTKGVK